MSVSLPNGSTIAIASGYGSADAFAAISNAVEAVVSDPAHNFANGDVVEITSGWVRLTGRLARVKSAVANTSYVLEGIDTSDIARYPAGGGVGSCRKVTGWTQISQVLSSSSTGGEQQFKEYAFLEDGAQRRIPTTKSAQGYTLAIADDPLQPHYAVLKAADTDRSPRGIKITLANNSPIFANAYVSMNDTPTLTVNEIMALEVTLSLLSSTTRYVS